MVWLNGIPSIFLTITWKKIGNCDVKPNIWFHRYCLCNAKLDMPSQLLKNVLSK